MLNVYIKLSANNTYYHGDQTVDRLNLAIDSGQRIVNEMLRKYVDQLQIALSKTGITKEYSKK